MLREHGSAPCILYMRTHYSLPAVRVITQIALIDKRAPIILIAVVRYVLICEMYAAPEAHRYSVIAYGRVYKVCFPGVARVFFRLKIPRKFQRDHSRDTSEEYNVLAGHYFGTITRYYKRPRLSIDSNMPCATLPVRSSRRVNHIGSINHGLKGISRNRRAIEEASPTIRRDAYR